MSRGVSDSMWFSIVKKDPRHERFQQEVEDKYGEGASVKPFNLSRELTLGPKGAFRQAGWKRIGKSWVMEGMDYLGFPNKLVVPLKKQSYAKQNRTQQLPRERRLREYPQGPTGRSMHQHRSPEKYSKWWEKMKPEDRENWRESVVDTSKPQKVKVLDTKDVESLTPTYSENKEDYVIMRQTGMFVKEEDIKKIQTSKERDEWDYTVAKICVYPYFTPHDSTYQEISYPDWAKDDEEYLSNLSSQLHSSICIDPSPSSNVDAPIADLYVNIAFLFRPETIRETMKELRRSGMADGVGFEPNFRVEHKDNYAITQLFGSNIEERYLKIRQDANVNNLHDRLLPTFPISGNYLVNGEWTSIDGTEVEEE